MDRFVLVMPAEAGIQGCENGASLEVHGHPLSRE